MNILQTYYNREINSKDLNYKGGYLRPEINWLSIAYSCLLLKKYNPEKQLVLYGNEEVICILIDLFKLPYDNYQILPIPDDGRERFYCYPKIQAYRMQKDAFVHIDTDVYMWEPIPDKMLSAGLIAQHEEEDSDFYMYVYNHMKECGVQLLDVQKCCLGEGYIHSYNAGMIGGNDLDFFHEYVHKIESFIDMNMPFMMKSDKPFLFNVVFEQWMYYALAQYHHKPVTTYIDGVVKDFKMPWGIVPEQIVDWDLQKYIHIMEYKRQIQCNRFIVRNMYTEFHDYYERILSVCKEHGVIVKEKTGNDELLDIQMRQKGVVDEYRTKKRQFVDSVISISPSVEIRNLSDAQVQVMHKASQCDSFAEYKSVLAYDAFMNQPQEFLYSGQWLQLLSLFRNPIKMSELLGEIGDDSKKEMLIRFVKQNLFNNVLYVV